MLEIELKLYSTGLKVTPLGVYKPATLGYYILEP